MFLLAFWIIPSLHKLAYHILLIDSGWLCGLGIRRTCTYEYRLSDEKNIEKNIQHNSKPVGNSNNILDLS